MISIILIDASERNIMYLYHSQYIWWKKEEGKWNFDKEIHSKVNGSISLNILFKVVEVPHIKKISYVCFREYWYLTLKYEKPCLKETTTKWTENKSETIIFEKLSEIL